ncbi:E3 ubiquitin-protein ligase MARCHF1-like [Amyelois transitella]|uniref:E3 ubiquitin-protein ligase MARCHF1-like n=1 Tax=Amyelois transitella TaxID=680683 RepID=UPI00298F6D8D|nr:E3 ubiquitin-protein ligase MARCHF1-like [Amyelois transitella]
MRRFVTLSCLVDCTDQQFPRDAIQNLRHAVLAPAVYAPRIQQALRNIDFKFHRSCSYQDILLHDRGAECETLLMFWGGGRSDSRFTMSASSCSSIHMPTSPTSQTSGQREKEMRTVAQQTEISCRTPGIASPNLVPEADSMLCAQFADSLAFSSPASSLLQPAGRSMSILGSVCALLLNKQGTSGIKQVSSFTGSRHSDNICRICFGGESAERLVRPCSCRGTIAAVHRTCLERWLLQAATSYCELCRHHYIVTRSHKWSWLRSLAEWARSGRGRALAADAWRGAALGAASVLGTARALHACDRALQLAAQRGGAAVLAANLFSSLLIGIIGALNGLLTTWMLLKIQEHQLSWQAWRDSTLHVHVSLADEELVSRRSSQDTVVPSSASAAQPPASPTADRSTNIADPFMVTLPFIFPEP